MPPYPKFIRMPDPETGEAVIVFKHDWADETELRLGLISAVAELTEVSPQQIETELRGRADPDALDRIFQPQPDDTPREGSRLLLFVASCQVRVQANGWVEVTRTAD